MSKKAALVTGGSDRIGRAIALQLAKQGYHIILHYNSSAQSAQQTKADICALGVDCKTVSFNFRQQEATIQFFTDACPGFDLQILINNASDFKPSSLSNPSSDLLHHHYHINFLSAYMLTKTFALHHPKGHIINILDTNINKNRTRHFDYLLFKKLLQSFTEMAAVELAPHFRVNAIAPGLILPPPGEDTDYLLKKAQHIPLQSVGNLEQIQNAVQYLVNNPFLTGQIIYVDGGERL